MNYSSVSNFTSSVGLGLPLCKPGGSVSASPWAASAAVKAHMALLAEQGSGEASQSEDTFGDMRRMAHGFLVPGGFEPWKLRLQDSRVSMESHVPHKHGQRGPFRVLLKISCGWHDGS